MVDHPADIVSPTSDHVLPLKTSTVDAAAAGRVPYDKPTPENSVMLLIDHQIGLMVGVRDFTSLATYKANVIGLAKMAKALGIPTLLSSSNAQWQNGDTLPELRELFCRSADLPPHRDHQLLRGPHLPARLREPARRHRPHARDPFRGHDRHLLLDADPRDAQRRLPGVPRYRCLRRLELL